MGEVLAYVFADLERQSRAYTELRKQRGYLRGRLVGLEIQIKNLRAAVSTHTEEGER